MNNINGNIGDSADAVTGDDIQVFDSVQITERQYIFTPYIPKRCVTLLQGDPQSGKSTLVRAIAAALSSGLPLPPNGETREPIRVLLNNAEDDFASVTVPHLKKLGANMSILQELTRTISRCSFMTSA